MAELPESHLLDVFRKCGALADRGLITAPEFISKAFDEFAYIGRVYSDIIPAPWESVPVGIREDFAGAVHQASQPAFRWHPFYMGGDRPITEAELRREADLRTARVRTWAVEIVGFLAGASATTSPNPALQRTPLRGAAEFGR